MNRCPSAVSSINLPEGDDLRDFIAGRHARGRLWSTALLASTILAVIALTALLVNIVDGASGFVAIENAVDPQSLSVDGIALQDLESETLIQIIGSHVSAAVVRRLESEQPLAKRSRQDLYELVIERVVKPEVKQGWTLSESIFGREEIQVVVAEQYPKAQLVFRSWLSLDFLTSPQSSVPERAGVRTALLGTLWTLLITIALAFPLGVGAAVYLEEYAGDTFLNRIIRTNINNLAGVPSIIYGLLGLAIFVRSCAPITSGAAFGRGDPTTANGRTILSAGLTLALLVLPLIIINAQEAVRSVPRSLRYGSLSLGATQWQTIRSHVLPQALPGILTGTILAMSRAIGETAPLVVVGATTYIVIDPSGPFSKFTTLPMQIYQWTARPQADFRRIAAAASLLLLVLLLAMNATAIVLRNHHSQKGCL